MSAVTVFVVTHDALAAFARPAIDLRTGELVELAVEIEPVQLELPLDQPVVPPGN